jgi:hypothetical protein
MFFFFSLLSALSIIFNKISPPEPGGANIPILSFLLPSFSFTGSSKHCEPKQDRIVDSKFNSISLLK